MIPVTPTWNERASYKSLTSALAVRALDGKTPQGLRSPSRCAYCPNISMTQRLTSATVPAIQTCHKLKTGHRAPTSDRSGGIPSSSLRQNYGGCGSGYAACPSLAAAQARDGYRKTRDIVGWRLAYALRKKGSPVAGRMQFSCSGCLRFLAAPAQPRKPIQPADTAELRPLRL
jgi:hypothetical protein